MCNTTYGGDNPTSLSYCLTHLKPLVILLFSAYNTSVNNSSQVKLEDLLISLNGACIKNNSKAYTSTTSDSFTYTRNDDHCSVVVANLFLMRFYRGTISVTNPNMVNSVTTPSFFPYKK